MPLLKGCILLDEAIKEACAKLPSEYRVQVDQIDLREDDLRDKIQRAGLMAGRYEYLATLERQKETPDLARASHLSRSAGRYMEIEQRLQEKLQKLLAFNSSSVHIFAHIQPLLAAVQQGLKQTNGVWQADKKAFRLPDVKDMAWTKTVEEKWDKSPSGIQQLIDKVESGANLSTKEMNALSQYLIEHPNSRLYDKALSAFYTSLRGNEEVANFMVGLFTTIGTEHIGDFVDGTIDSFGQNLASEVSENIFKNRYSIKLFSGAILGKTPGATRLYREIAENTLGATFKGLGKAASFSSGLLMGVGVDMMMGDTLSEAIGKEITVGVTTTVVTGTVYLGSAALVGLGVISAPVSLGVGAVIGIGVGVSLLNDWACEEWPELKQFEDNIGQAVVDTWDTAVSALSDGFSYINPFD